MSATFDLDAWKRADDERTALAATFEYSQSSARRCAGHARDDRITSAYGTLIAAINDDTCTRDDLKTLATELEIACCFEVTS